MKKILLTAFFSISVSTLLMAQDASKVSAKKKLNVSLTEQAKSTPVESSAKSEKTQQLEMMKAKQALIKARGNTSNKQQPILVTDKDLNKSN